MPGQRDDPPGDSRSLANVYVKYANEMFLYGTGLGFSREILRDAIQDIFFKLYDNKAILLRIDNPKAYLFRALKNRLLNVSRDTRPRVEVDDPQRGDYEFSVGVTVLDEMITTEEKNVISERVERYLRSLTPRQREAIWLRYMQEMEYEQIAELLDMSVHGARKLISRAILRMREEGE